MATKEDYDAAKRSFGTYKAHLTRVCDANTRLATLSAMVGPVFADGLQRGLLALDERLDVCEKQLLVRLRTCPAKDHDAVEALCDPIYQKYEDNRELILEALAKVAPDPNTSAAHSFGGGGCG